jgi:hypothetical protein
MVELEESIPLGVVSRTPSNLVEVRPPVRELVSAPGEEEHVLRSAQPQQAVVNRIDPEYDEPRAGALDLAAKVALDFVLGNWFQSGLYQRVTCRQGLGRAAAL